jgi:hypothetical protein
MSGSQRPQLYRGQVVNMNSSVLDEATNVVKCGFAAFTLIPLLQ